jgi:hypothetical protein
MAGNRALSNAKHIARMSPTAAEPGRTPPDPLPQSGDFVTVKIGTYIDDIENVSIKDSSWAANFYVWFSWKGDPKLDPGAKLVVVDGAIAKKELLEDYHGADGTNYQRYKVTARMVKFFDTARVPIEDHMLNIYVEDGARDGSRLRFLADPALNVSSRVNLPGFRITGYSQAVKSHTYSFPPSRNRCNIAPHAQRLVEGFCITLLGSVWRSDGVRACWSTCGIRERAILCRPACESPCMRSRTWFLH